MVQLQGAVSFLLAFAGNAPEHLQNRVGFATATFGPSTTEGDCLAKLQAIKVEPPGKACRDLAGLAGPNAVHQCHEKAKLGPRWTCVSLGRTADQAAGLYRRILLREPRNVEAQAGYAAQLKEPPLVTCGFVRGCFRWAGPPIVCHYPDRDPLYSDMSRRSQAAAGSEEQCAQLRRATREAARSSKLLNQHPHPKARVR